ncbi:MAG: hypothetical protein U0Y08_02765 [Bacteroidia bacterium]
MNNQESNKSAGRLRTFVRIVLLLLVFYLVLYGFKCWLGWHFEHPITPAS